MERSLVTLHCSQHDPGTRRAKPFRVVRYRFYYQSSPQDRQILDEISKRGLQLAQSVNPHAANYATAQRQLDKIQNNCVAGLLAEYLWKDYLNHQQEIVAEVAFVGAKSQIDLEVIANGQKIEVRSSFPRNGIPFAICHAAYEFDIIGPYANDYKPDEIAKDFYVRTLFHLAKISERTTSSGRILPLIEKLMDKMTHDGFEVYLTGGATCAMMQDERLSNSKNLIAEDEINAIRLQTASAYRVVPFHNALDSVEMYEL
ncbi:MAG: hypothetical protein ACK4GN_14255, partial [Runella sp.]